MKIVMILVPLMLILVALGILLFSWAVRNGQYDDLEGPAHRILYDDDDDRIPEDAKTSEQKTLSSTDDKNDPSDKGASR
jgi:cbb3-type cytochrome oxidase maturation protein